MNEEFELRKRISDADRGREAPDLNQSIVARAALGKPRRQLGFRGFRLAMGSASVAVTAVALAITLPVLMTPAPLFTVATSASGGERLSSSADNSTRMAESSAYWPGWISYEYTPGPAVTGQTGTGQVFQGNLTGDPLDILNQLGIIFGLTGEPVRDEWSDDDFPSYSITQGNASLSIYWSGTGSWSFSNWADYRYDCAEDIAEKTDEGSLSCEPQPTPELIPSIQELKDEAVALLQQVGLHFQPGSITIFRDDWGAYASLPYLTDGVDSGLQTYLNWGMDGQLNYFSSHNLELKNRGSFDTISAIDAVSRISGGRWYGNPPESFYQDLGGESALDSRMASSEPAPEGGAVREAKDEPMVVDDTGGDYEPEVLQLRVERSVTAMLSVWDSAGNYWLVPGYVLFNDQGWFDAVISLQEGVVELPEPMEILPMEVIREGPAVSEIVD